MELYPTVTIIMETLTIQPESELTLVFKVYYVVSIVDYSYRVHKPENAKKL
jgi:hypothetical protein